MGIFGIGKRPSEEPSGEPVKKFTPKELEQMQARNSEMTTREQDRKAQQENRETLEGIMKSMHDAGLGTYNMPGLRKIEERLNNIPANTIEDKLPKGKSNDDNQPPKRRWWQ